MRLTENILLEAREVIAGKLRDLWKGRLVIDDVDAVIAAARVDEGARLRDLLAPMTMTAVRETWEREHLAAEAGLHLPSALDSVRGWVLELDATRAALAAEREAHVKTRERLTLLGDYPETALHPGPWWPEAMLDKVAEHTKTLNKERNTVFSEMVAEQRKNSKLRRLMGKLLEIAPTQISRGPHDTAAAHRKLQAQLDALRAKAKEAIRG